MRRNIKKCIAFFAAICCIITANNLHAQKIGASGDYILSSIMLEDNSMQDTLKGVPVFEDASINCLLNSQWQFDKGDGYYKINKATECAKGIRGITWKFFNLKGSNFFQFCRTSAVRGVRADEHNIYICEVQSSAKASFTLRYPIMYADKSNAIIFTFTRKEGL